jgi:hypothetical protein
LMPMRSLLHFSWAFDYDVNWPSPPKSFRTHFHVAGI